MFDVTEDNQPTAYDMLFREHIRANAKERLEMDGFRDKVRKYQIERKYQITLCEWLDIYELQDGLCAICGKDLPALPTQGTALDHCHVNQRVRGILCPPCNSALGWRENHRAAIDSYLASPPAYRVLHPSRRVNTRTLRTKKRTKPLFVIKEEE